MREMGHRIVSQSDIELVPMLMRLCHRCVATMMDGRNVWSGAHKRDGHARLGKHVPNVGAIAWRGAA
jgi:hypothetical protein